MTLTEYIKQAREYKHKCETCGSDVKVSGKTTQHYEPIPKDVLLQIIEMHNEALQEMRIQTFDFLTENVDDDHISWGLFGKIKKLENDLTKQIEELLKEEK